LFDEDILKFARHAAKEFSLPCKCRGVPVCRLRRESCEKEFVSRQKLLLIMATAVRSKGLFSGACIGEWK
jgi:hypothetical protein